MERLTVKCDAKKKISNIIFFVGLLIFFGISSYFSDSSLINIISFVLFIILFILFSLDEVLPKKVFLKDGLLCLRILGFSKCITIKDVLWYSENTKNIYSLFCKSSENLCLFYNGKKVFISIKEKETLKKELELNNVFRENQNIYLNPYKINFPYRLRIYLKDFILPVIIVFFTYAKAKYDFFQNDSMLEVYLLLNFSLLVVILSILFSLILEIYENFKYRKLINN